MTRPTAAPVPASPPCRSEPPAPVATRRVAAAAFVLALAGCATLDERQREWIFQPSDRTWAGGAAAAEGMSDVWIEFTLARGPARCAAGQAARPVAGAAACRRARAAVPARRALGRSLERPPHAPHARAGLRGARHRLPWLRPKHAGAAVGRRWRTKTRWPPGNGWPRSIRRHSATCSAIRSAARSRCDWPARSNDAAGLIVEGSFTSIPEVVKTMKWGWLPVAPLITQRFDAGAQIERVNAPLLVVHGSEDRLIQPDARPRAVRARPRTQTLRARRWRHAPQHQCRRPRGLPRSGRRTVRRACNELTMSPPAARRANTEVRSTKAPDDHAQAEEGPCRQTGARARCGTRAAARRRCAAQAESRSRRRRPSARRGPTRPQDRRATERRARSDRPCGAKRATRAGGPPRRERPPRPATRSRERAAARHAARRRAARPDRAHPRDQRRDATLHHRRARPSPHAVPPPRRECTAACAKAIACPSA